MIVWSGYGMLLEFAIKLTNCKQHFKIVHRISCYFWTGFLCILIMARLVWLVLLLVCTHAVSKLVDGEWEMETSPLVIGHRGAPSYRPEETLSSYEVGNFQAASFIEIDLCVTQDGFLVWDN